MTAETTAHRYGHWVYGLGVILVALVGLSHGGFVPGQSVPKDFPARTILAYAAGGFMLVAGAAVIWRRTAAWAAVALAAYFGVVVVLVMDARLIVTHYAEYVVYSSIAEQLAIAAGGLILYARFAAIDPALAARLTRIGQIAFGVCAVLFGGAHFAYMNLTAPLVPKWLPPSQLFWGYATGVFHILGGLGILFGVRARLAAILLTVMYLAFAPLVHIPAILTDPANTTAWVENATNLVLAGVAWVVADSLGRD